jgi:hypothetical protein
LLAGVGATGAAADDAAAGDGADAIAGGVGLTKAAVSTGFIATQSAAEAAVGVLGS